jgi:hypothetical protein
VLSSVAGVGPSVDTAELLTEIVFVFPVPVVSVKFPIAAVVVSLLMAKSLVVVSSAVGVLPSGTVTISVATVVVPMRVEEIPNPVDISKSELTTHYP